MIRNVGPFKPFGVDKLPKSTKSYKVKLHNDGDELCWSENEIIWSKFRCLLHQLTLPGEIIDATICTIDKERYLAVLYQTGLTLFSYSGESFLIPLPFQIAKIFPLHKSLLLFRSPNSSLIHSQYSDFPVLFTLFHVLEEIRPVAFSTPNISTPLPKYTTIQTPKTFGDSFADFEKDLSYITDLGFVPLQVSDQRGYLLSYANDSISIWKLRDANRSRDLLFSSPHYIRSPSIFSPPAIKPYLYSPTTDARIEIKSTLEGIPPDLYMEMIYEFNQSEPTNCSFIDISDGNKKILLFLHNHKLIGLDISYNNSDKILFTIEEVESICRFKELMFFVVYTDKTLVLHEEEHAIIHLPFENVKNIQKLGKRFICTFTNNTSTSFYFDLSFKPIIYSLLEVLHLSLSSDSYATLILSLSEAEALSDYSVFVPDFINLLTSLVEKEEIIKFIHLAHLLYEDIRLQKDKEEELKMLTSIMIQLSQIVELPQYILYYSLHSNNDINIEINDFKINSISQEVPNIIEYCCKCIEGKRTEEFKKIFPLSKKIIDIFSLIYKANDVRDIVVTTARSKLTLNELQNIIPGISILLKKAFKSTANSPPLNWPLAAYELIGREDISTLYKYIENEKVKNIIDFSQPDLRFLEVERLLQSHIPLTIDVERPNGTDDIQFQAMLIEKLGILLGKQWSLSIGRGLFNFNTFEPLSSQVLKFDTLNNCGFTDNAIELKPDEEFLKQEKLEWPQFHNGVSSSLTIINADNSWILDTITKEINPQTAGALFGFGITGLLKKVWKSELYNYLNSNELKDINIIATLLGLGISYRSTRDILISNMITQYIPELHQFNDDDEEISPLIQSSAIVGIGFLFESSCNRHFTEIFMNMLQESSLMEIPTQPLSLGISIGLINLGKGDKSSVLRDNREKLCEIFCGNKSLDAESEKIITFGNSDFFSIAPSSMFSLILGYLRTDSEHVKKALSLPEDSTYINTLVPDIVLMRTMGSLLIDSKPESALNFCVPKGLEPEILTAMVTGFSIACGVKYAGTLNIKAFERIMTIAKCLSLLEKEPFDFKDCNVLYREQCLSIVLVSCSLIIAGTCEVDFLRFVRFIRRRPISTTLTQYNFGFHMMLSMAIGILNLGKGRYTIGRNNSQTAAILIALYPRISRFIEDNDFYLQPLRHLISIAAVPRVLEVRDVFTQEILHVMAHVILKDGTEVIMNTPHVLPPFELIKSIVIDDNKYYKINFEQLENEDKRPIIWVKKLSDEHVKEKLDVENLRMVLKMKENSLLSTKNETNNEYEIQKCKVEIDCDEIGNKIMEFLRSDSVKERINMLKDHKLKNFLLFYAIDPSAKISDVRKFDDDAISFLMPFMNEKEILALENSNI